MKKLGFQFLLGEGGVLALVFPTEIPQGGGRYRTFQMEMEFRFREMLDVFVRDGVTRLGHQVSS
jgi:hypothetical protein